jgi:protein RecA
MSEKKPAQARLDISKDSVQAVIEKMNKKYGANTLALASQAEAVTLDFIPTGIWALDFRLFGGIVENRITEIHGNYSTFKTTILLKAIANFQKKYDEGFAPFIDLEGTYPALYAKALGVDNNRVVLVNPSCGEEAVDAANDLLTWEIPILLGVDSIAALQPMSIQEKSAAESGQNARHAVLVGRFMQTVTARLKKNMYNSKAPSCTVICTNQIREKAGVSFGNPEYTPGGRAKDFMYSVTIRLRATAGGAEMEKVKINEITREMRVAQEVKFEITKNKAGSSQYEDGIFVYYPRSFKGNKAGTFDNHDELFRNALFYNLISIEMRLVKKERKPFYVYGELACQDDKQFVRTLREDEALSEELYDKTLQKFRDDNEAIFRSLRGEDDPEIVAEEVAEPVEEKPRKKFRLKLNKKAFLKP